MKLQLSLSNEMSCYVDQTKEMECSIVFVKRRLIYFALSFMYLLGIRCIEEVLNAVMDAVSEETELRVLQRFDF